jgi:hypothetical protein
MATELEAPAADFADQALKQTDWRRGKHWLPDFWLVFSLFFSLSRRGESH